MILKAYLPHSRKFHSLVDSHGIAAHYLVVFSPCVINLKLKLLKLPFVQNCCKPLEGVLTVKKLASLLGRSDDGACGDVYKSHAGLHFVYMLTAFAAAVKSLHDDIS